MIEVKTNESSIDFVVDHLHDNLMSHLCEVLGSSNVFCASTKIETHTLFRKVTEFSSLQILQSGCNPRHLNSRAFLDCSGLHLDYMDYKVIKWIAEQYNPKQSKGNLCNPSAIHCNLGLQFCFAIQINLCNLTAIQEDCSLIAEIAVALLRLQRFSNLHIRLVILPRVGEVA